MMRKKFYARDGFTLIELLVVITIITILSGFLVANYLNTQMRGRDARRKADLKQIAAALEVYRSDWGVYPSDSSNHVKQPYKFGPPATAISPANITFDTYFQGKKIPLDPLYSDPTITCDATHKLYLFYDNGNGNGYMLFANLENGNDPDVVKSKSYLPPGPYTTDGYTLTFNNGVCGNATYNYWITNQ